MFPHDKTSIKSMQTKGRSMVLIPFTHWRVGESTGLFMR